MNGVVAASIILHNLALAVVAWRVRVGSVLVRERSGPSVGGIVPPGSSTGTWLAGWLAGWLAANEVA
jgi:hypothetical protein